MTQRHGPDNRLVLTGTVVRLPECRNTPAGVSIGRFMLDHEFGGGGGKAPGLVRFRIGIRVTDPALLETMQSLQPGMRLTVMGHLCTADHRAHRQTFEVHARRLDLDQKQTD